MRIGLLISGGSEIKFQPAAVISAAHHLKDPGAVSKWGVERDKAIELRGLVEDRLKAKGAPYIKDRDTETLGQYLNRIKPGNGSVLAEIHWNAAMSLTATGTEVLIADNHTKYSYDFADELSRGMAQIMGIRNRGVKTESDSARGRLALTRKAGITALIEVCFISNESDMKKYEANKCEIAEFIAKTLIKYEKRI